MGKKEIEVKKGSVDKKREQVCFKIAFWNVAGLKRKNRDYWKGLE